jgi:hypothetical protein
MMGKGPTIVFSAAVLLVFGAAVVEYGLDLRPPLLGEKLILEFPRQRP